MWTYRVFFARAIVYVFRLKDDGFHIPIGDRVGMGQGDLIGEGVRRETKTGKARRGQSERGLRGCRCQATKHTPIPKGRKPPGGISSSDTVGAESYRTLERDALLTLPTSLDPESSDNDRCS